MVNIADEPVSCPECGNIVRVKVVADDDSNIFSRFLGKDGWHREFRCPACQWVGRTENNRDKNKRIPVVGGESYDQHRKHHR